MKLILRFLLSLFAGLALGFGFDFLFLGASDRPLTDQLSLMVFSASAISYLTFTLLQSPRELLNSFRWPKGAFGRDAISSLLREHLPGILLALVFFTVYINIGLRLNLPGIDTVDNFLDADNSSWMMRIAAPEGYQLEMRGPHPFAYFILRPVGWITNLFTQNYALASILVNTFAGGLCVFFTWVFMKNQTENRTYALLMACLLGLSTAQIFFGSVIESYVFSAAVLVVYFVLLQSRQESKGSLVAAGLVTFGITLTNFVQNLIGFIVSRPRLKEIIRFAGLTISAGIVLSLIHAAWYPSSKLFFLPSEVLGEDEFAVSILGGPSWKALGRITLLTRTILLYTIIAPRPYVFEAEVGGTFPRFNFFKIVPGTFSHSSYDGLGNVLVMAWAILLLISAVVFLRDMARSRKTDLRLAFVLCILFNFILHLNYGYEPFLYSPDWAYALIFLVGMSLAPFAKNRIFQGGMAIFLVLLAYNQFQFFQFVFQTIAPFVGQAY